MAKYIFLADTHIKGVNPCNRKGDYYKDIMTKIKEVIDIAKEKGADAIIHSGDLYDSPNVSNLMVDDFIDMVEKSNIQWYIVPGNHDMISHNWSLSKASSLAHIFRRSKLIHKLNSFINKDIKPSFIQGFQYYHNIEQDIKEKGIYANIDKKFKGFKIAVTHAMITHKSFPFEVMHVLAKDIKTDFDVIIHCHYHIGSGIKELNGVKFVKLPALGRTGIDEIKIDPCCAYIDTSTREIEFILLKSVKPGEEVFNIEKIAEQKKFNADIDNFINSLKGVKFQSLDIRGIIEEIAKQKNIDKEVVDCVIERIGRFE